MVFLNPPPRHSCECNCAAALRKENTRLKDELLDRNGHVLRLTRERDEARAKADALEQELKHSEREWTNARAEAAAFQCSECGWHHAVDCSHKAEVSRLEGLILRGMFSQCVPLIEACDKMCDYELLLAEALRIRTALRGDKLGLVISEAE